VSSSGSPPRCCRSCGTRLAGDNRAALCSPCGRRVDVAAAQAPRMPDEFWQRPGLQVAFKQKRFGAVVRAYRLAFGGQVTQAHIAGWLDLSQEQVSRIERGQSVVNDLHKLDRWTQALRIPKRYLWFTAPAQASNAYAEQEAGFSLPRSDEPGLIPAEALRTPERADVRSLDIYRNDSERAPDEPIVEDTLIVSDLLMVDLLALAWTLGRLDQRLDRRGTLQLAAALAAAPALGMADPIERITHALTRPTGLTEDMVQYLETRSIGFHELESFVPAGQIFRALLAHLNDITTLLQVCPQTQDTLRIRLARTAGETAVLGAWLAWDLGDTQRAASLYRTTELASRESGDLAILACSVIYQSFALAEAGEHLTSQRRLAEVRQALPEHSDLATHAWLLGREAEEVAAMGNPAAKDMIENASELLIRERSMRERPWTRCLESPNLTHMHLAIATRLADETGVHRYVGDLAALAGDPTRKGTGRYLASIGLALVAIGDVREGIQAGQRSLEAVKTSQARYALDRLTELDAALTGTSPQERDLREGIRATRQELLSPRPPTSDRRRAPH